jgi:hypothetical protein
MQRLAGAQQMARDRSSGGALAHIRRGAVPTRALVAAALLSLAAGSALYEAAPARHAAAPAAPRQSAVTHTGLLGLPVLARGPVSSALGAAYPGFSVHDADGRLAATNPSQHLSTSFTTSGVSIRAGATRVRMRLVAVGFGSMLQAVGSATPRPRGNRVTYEHHGLDEWYANGPLGLEQGFTVARAPARRARGPLALAIGLSGDAQASLQSGGQEVALTSYSHTGLRYTGLSATDASGHRLRTWIGLRRGQILLHVDASRARFPLQIDPFVQQGKKITGKEEVEFSFLGTSVALSADGNTALVGGPGDNKVGAAWVFTRTGETWAQQGKKLTGKEEVGFSQFGSAVALSADGNTALIGGTEDNAATGAVWVFTRSGSTWAQQGPKLTATDESEQGGFGNAVALSADGNTALIGGHNDNAARGAAWVFTRIGETWTQQGPKLTETENGFFGWSVALSADGNTALIGSPGGELIGAAWVFTRTGETWTQQAKLTGEGESGEGRVGVSVALSEDGNTALAGGPGDNGFKGAAWVFTRTGEAWTEQGPKLIGAGENGEAGFGFSVALTGDANTALIGGPEDNKAAGAAWVFTRSSGVWTDQAKLTGKEESGKPFFGESVALSAEGATAVIGGPADGQTSTKAPGAVWAFVNTTPKGCAYNPPKVQARWHYSAPGGAGKWSGINEVKCGKTTTFPAQAMEGDLKLNPGTALKAGYDFMLPNNKSPFTVEFSEGKVVLPVRCVSGKPPSQPTLTVTLANQTYPVVNANWVPSAEQTSPLTYQGEVAIPNLCAGGQVQLNQPDTFSTFMLVH